MVFSGYTEIAFSEQPFHFFTQVRRTWMILRISRKKDEFDNQLVVRMDGQPRYVIVERPPFGKIVCDLDGNTMLSASYSPFENIVDKFFPKWLFGLESKLYPCTMIDSSYHD